MMKKIIIAIMMISVIAAAGGCKAKEDNTQADVIKLVNQPQEQAVEAYGVLRCTEKEDIALGFNASVEKVNVKNGQRVKKGDPLLELNLEDYNNQLKQLETELTLLKEQSMETEIPQEKLDLMEENLEYAKGKLNNGNMEENRLIADIENCVVYNLDYISGDMIAPGCRLLTLADLDSIKVMADIDQQYIGYVTLGAEVDIIPEYNKNTTLKGTVTFISSKAFLNNGETVVPVEITFQERIEGLIPDSDVQVRIYPAK